MVLMRPPQDAGDGYREIRKRRLEKCQAQIKIPGLLEMIDQSRWRSIIGSRKYITILMWVNKLPFTKVFRYHHPKLKVFLYL